MGMSNLCCSLLIDQYDISFSQMRQDIASYRINNPPKLTFIGLYLLAFNIMGATAVIGLTYPSGVPYVINVCLLFVCLFVFNCFWLFCFAFDFGVGGHIKSVLLARGRSCF